MDSAVKYALHWSKPRWSMASLILGSCCSSIGLAHPVHSHHPLGSNCLLCSLLDTIIARCFRLIGNLTNSWQAITCVVVLGFTPISAWKQKTPPCFELIVPPASEKPSTAVCCISICSSSSPFNLVPADVDSNIALSSLNLCVYQQFFSSSPMFPCHVVGPYYEGNLKSLLFLAVCQSFERTTFNLVVPRRLRFSARQRWRV